jgi:nucleotide-binding universal stress UspA family protein
MAGPSERLHHPGEADREPANGGPVIACIDAGLGGAAAARIAASLARRLGARVLFTTVQQATSPVPVGADRIPTGPKHSPPLLASGAGELDQSAELRVVVGEPAEQLIALAQREAAQLIVVASPDESAGRLLVLGSVYLALAGAGPCPVVIVPPGVQGVPAARATIVCGLDGSGPSLTAARVAAGLAHRLDARLQLVHATCAPPVSAPRAGGDHDAAFLRYAAESLPEDTAIDVLVEHGPPAERLADVAERQSAQLIVIGSRGRGSLASTLLGSAASELARTQSRRPLVIVPPNAGSSHVRVPMALAARHPRNDGVARRVRREIDTAPASDSSILPPACSPSSDRSDTRPQARWQP